MTPEQAMDKLDKTVIGSLELKIFLWRVLEKQIPKKPIPIIDNRTRKRVISWGCPNPCCDNDYLGGNEYHFDCCEYCGQKLDWGK